MTLINADKLHYKRVLLNDCTQSAVVVFAKEIDKAEKIKAIPIEWIDTYCTDSDIGLRDNDHAAIKKLLEDWKKENADT